jgi:hypothetical protein
VEYKNIKVKRAKHVASTKKLKDQMKIKRTTTEKKKSRKGCQARTF